MFGSQREAWKMCDGFGGAMLVTLFVNDLEFKTHLTSIGTTAFCSDTPSHLVCA
jgi:hypothetical protein